MASTRPGTDVAVHEISLGDSKDVDRAASAAAAAVSGWWNREPVQRGRVLTAIAAQRVW
jgi:aldehyde dehydrogenase (NAD+)